MSWFKKEMSKCFVLVKIQTPCSATSTTTSPPPVEVEVRKRRKKMERQVLFFCLILLFETIIAIEYGKFFMIFPIIAISAVDVQIK